MILYYEYNRADKHPLRVPMTEDAYLKAKDDPERWFINFGDCVLEVNKQEYDKYYVEHEHSRYIRRNAARRLDEQTTLDCIEDVCTYAQSVFSAACEKSVEDEVIDREMQRYLAQRVHEALEKLDSDEQTIVIEITIKKTSQKHLSQEFGVTQQCISKRYRRIREKLRAMLSDLDD